jgi:hypothetical protein
MLPHPDTVIKIAALRCQERLDEIARQRCALSVNPGARTTDPDGETRSSGGPPAQTIDPRRDSGIRNILAGTWLGAVTESRDLKTQRVAHEELGCVE